MKIEAIRIKNFKAFKDVEMRNIPSFCVIVGANGTGKSTLFSVFELLKESISSNVRAALGKMGGSKGINEVRTRGETGDIEIEIKYREAASKPLVTYLLAIGEDESGNPIVKREILKYRRGAKGQPWHFLDFSNGEGHAVTNEMDSVTSESDLQRENQSLRSPDILAIKGLAQFEKFPAANALGELIENWHVSDFHIGHARPEQQAGYAEHLSSTGSNLSLVVEYLHQRHPKVFQQILTNLSNRVPGVDQVDSKTTEEGRVLLRFKDGSFEDPFLARYVSDGTIKMLAYLVLLYDPEAHPLLCVEEPENQLYPHLLEELAEEFRLYSQRGGQVMVSSHSPDFLNAVNINEVFWLVKKDGFTSIERANSYPQLVSFVEHGDKMGYLWKQGLFEGVDP